MGQKTHPIGIRLGINKTWDSKWFAKKNYKNMLFEDLTIQKFIKTNLYHAGVPKVEIERTGKKIRAIIHTARPGIIIGKKGAEVEKLKKELEKITGQEMTIDIKEIRKPELDATLVAENVALQLEPQHGEALLHRLQPALEVQGAAERAAEQRVDLRGIHHFLGREQIEGRICLLARHIRSTHHGTIDAVGCRCQGRRRGRCRGDCPGRRAG